MLVHGTSVEDALEILSVGEGGQLFATFKAGGPGGAVAPDFPGAGPLVWLGLDATHELYHQRYGPVVIVVDPRELRDYTVVARLDGRQYGSEQSFPIAVVRDTSIVPDAALSVKGFDRGVVPHAWPAFDQQTHAEIVVAGESRLRVRVAALRLPRHDGPCVRKVQGKPCECDDLDGASLQRHAFHKLLGRTHVVLNAVPDAKEELIAVSDLQPADVMLSTAELWVSDMPPFGFDFANVVRRVPETASAARQAAFVLLTLALRDGLKTAHEHTMPVGWEARVSNWFARDRSAYDVPCTATIDEGELLEAMSRLAVNGADLLHAALNRVCMDN
jgi:hypothetical protein